MLQGSQQWLEVRKVHVTSTDSASICGKNPFKSCYKLWREKMGLDAPEKENERMKRGSYLEPIAREYIAINHGIKCSPIVMFKDFMMASLDGISECGNYIVEIKCGDKSYQDALNNEEIPLYYQYQMQHQMYCADVTYGLYVAFNGDNAFIIRVEREEEIIKEILEKGKEFYQCMITFTQPELTEKDYIVRNDHTWIELSKRYAQTCEMRKKLQIQEEELKKQMVTLSGEQNSMGEGIKLSKVIRQGNIDYDSLVKKHNIDIEPYRKSKIEFWKISYNKTS